MKRVNFSQVFVWAFPLNFLLASHFFSSQNQNDPWIAPPEADAVLNPYNGNAKATEKGKILYEKLCWQCHGMTGNGDGPGAAVLDPKPANYSLPEVQKQSDGALVWKISTGRGTMPAFKTNLSLNERWMLVNYIRKLGKTTP